VARTLTADEQVRYPWASRITDYVPVGRLRKAALLCAGAGLLVLVVGMGIIVLRSVSIRHGLHVKSSPLGQVTLISSFALFGVAFVVGAVTAVSAWIRGAKTPLVWSLGAMVPGVVVLLIYFTRGI